MIVAKFSGQEFTIEDLKGDEDLIKFMVPQKGKKKATTKKSTPTERATSDYECNLCDARVWEKGFGGQCSKKKIDGECMCKGHLAKVAEFGPWWLGVVTQPRPPTEELHYHGKATGHKWQITADGGEIVPEKVVKKKPSPKASGEKKNAGRSKGSLKKKANSKDDEIAELMAQLAIAKKGDSGAGTGLKNKKVEEQVEEEQVEEEEEEEGGEQAESSDDENDFEAIVFEGVEYMMNPSDCFVMDPEDFAWIGVWNAEEENIDFEGDGEEVHNSKKIK